jgi:hypothetical protein
MESTNTELLARFYQELSNISYLAGSDFDVGYKLLSEWNIKHCTFMSHIEETLTSIGDTVLLFHKKQLFVDGEDAPKICLVISVVQRLEFKARIVKEETRYDIIPIVRHILFKYADSTPNSFELLNGKVTYESSVATYPTLHNIKTNSVDLGAFNKAFMDTFVEFIGGSVGFTSFDDDKGFIPAYKLSVNSSTEKSAVAKLGTRFMIPISFLNPTRPFEVNKLIGVIIKSAELNKDVPFALASFMEELVSIDSKFTIDKFPQLQNSLVKPSLTTNTGYKYFNAKDDDKTNFSIPSEGMKIDTVQRSLRMVVPNSNLVTFCGFLADIVPDKLFVSIMAFPSVRLAKIETTPASMTSAVALKDVLFNIYYKPEMSSLVMKISDYFWSIAYFHLMGETIYNELTGLLTRYIADPKTTGSIALTISDFFTFQIKGEGYVILDMKPDRVFTEDRGQLKNSLEVLENIGTMMKIWRAIGSGVYEGEVQVEFDLKADTMKYFGGLITKPNRYFPRFIYQILEATEKKATGTAMSSMFLGKFDALQKRMNNFINAKFKEKPTTGPTTTSSDTSFFSKPTMKIAPTKIVPTKIAPTKVGEVGGAPLPLTPTTSTGGFGSGGTTASTVLSSTVFTPTTTTTPTTTLLPPPEATTKATEPTPTGTAGTTGTPTTPSVLPSSTTSTGTDTSTTSTGTAASSTTSSTSSTSSTSKKAASKPAKPSKPTETLLVIPSDVTKSELDQLSVVFNEIYNWILTENTELKLVSVTNILTNLSNLADGIKTHDETKINGAIGEIKKNANRFVISHKSKDETDRYAKLQTSYLSTFNELSTAKKTITSLETQNRNLFEECEDLKTDVRKKDAKIKEKDAAIASFSNLLKEKEKQIEALKKASAFDVSVATTPLSDGSSSGGSSSGGSSSSFTPVVHSSSSKPDPMFEKWKITGGPPDSSTDFPFPKKPLKGKSDVEKVGESDGDFDLKAISSTYKVPSALTSVSRFDKPTYAKTPVDDFDKNKLQDVYSVVWYQNEAEQAEFWSNKDLSDPRPLSYRFSFKLYGQNEIVTPYVSFSPSNKIRSIHVHSNGAAIDHSYFVSIPISFSPDEITYPVYKKGNTNTFKESINLNNKIPSTGTIVLTIDGVSYNTLYDLRDIEKNTKLESEHNIIIASFPMNGSKDIKNAAAVDKKYPTVHSLALAIKMMKPERKLKNVLVWPKFELLGIVAISGLGKYPMPSDTLYRDL